MFNDESAMLQFYIYIEMNVVWYHCLHIRKKTKQRGIESHYHLKEN